MARIRHDGPLIIGGGLADAGDLVLEFARVAYADELTGGGHRPGARFAIATLGNDAGVIGAAALAREGRA